MQNEHVECTTQEWSGPQTIEEAQAFHHGFSSGATTYAVCAGDHGLKSENERLRRILDDQGFRTLEALEQIAEAGAQELREQPEGMPGTFMPPPRPEHLAESIATMIHSRLVRAFTQKDDLAFDAVIQELLNTGALLPRHLERHVEQWLASNEQRPDQVRWGWFPLGMVQQWIERADTAEQLVRKL